MAEHNLTDLNLRESTLEAVRNAVCLSVSQHISNRQESLAVSSGPPSGHVSSVRQRHTDRQTYYSPTEVGDAGRTRRLSHKSYHTYSLYVVTNAKQHIAQLDSVSFTCMTIC